LRLRQKNAIVKIVINMGGQKEGSMEWDWGSPIALGLFLIMAAAALVITAIAFAVITGDAKVSDLPGNRRR
jgi:hypothetical protein